MKKTFNRWSLSAVVAIAVLSLSAVSYAVPKNNITIQPIGFLFGVGNVEYETAMENTSIAARVNFAGYKIGDWETSMIGGGASYRFYLGEPGDAPRGMYVGPLANILSVTSTYDDETGSAMFFSVGGEFGYKWVWGEKTAFVLAPSLNLAYTAGELKVGDNTLGFGGFGFGLGLALGMGF